MNPRHPESVARHVFVVDDDSAVRTSIKFALELEGFEVHAYRSALELLIEDGIPSPGCLVVDYHLPGMNGLELVAKLRERNKALPAVLITSPNESLRSRAAASGISMVDKPMLGAPLLSAVHAAFDGETRLA
jgi:two-component system, LuxR family, response regulator FixJ